MGLPSILAAVLNLGASDDHRGQKVCCRPGLYEVWLPVKSVRKGFSVGAEDFRNLNGTRDPPPYEPNLGINSI